LPPDLPPPVILKIGLGGGGAGEKGSMDDESRLIDVVVRASRSLMEVRWMVEDWCWWGICKLSSFRV